MHVPAGTGAAAVVLACVLPQVSCVPDGCMCIHVPERAFWGRSCESLYDRACMGSEDPSACAVAWGRRSMAA